MTNRVIDENFIVNCYSTTYQKIFLHDVVPLSLNRENRAMPPTQKRDIAKHIATLINKQLLTCQ